MHYQLKCPPIMRSPPHSYSNRPSNPNFRFFLLPPDVSVSAIWLTDSTIRPDLLRETTNVKCKTKTSCNAYRTASNSSISSLENFIRTARRSSRLCISPPRSTRAMRRRRKVLCKLAVCKAFRNTFDIAHNALSSMVMQRSVRMLSGGQSIAARD